LKPRGAVAIVFHGTNRRCCKEGRWKKESTVEFNLERIIEACDFGKEVLVDLTLEYTENLD
jgi:hypothetical protein